MILSLNFTNDINVCWKGPTSLKISYPLCKHLLYLLLHAFPMECRKVMFLQVCVHPHPGGYPPAKVGMLSPAKVDTPPPPRNCTVYGMPLVFTPEDFLVLLYCVIRKRNESDVLKHHLLLVLVFLPPAYVVRWEGNSFTLFVSPYLGGSGQSSQGWGQPAGGSGQSSPGSGGRGGSGQSSRGGGEQPR